MTGTGFSLWLPLGGLAERIESGLDFVLCEFNSKGRAHVLDESDCRLFEQGIEFLDAVAEGMELVRDDKVLGAPIGILDKFTMAFEVFERMNEPEKNLAAAVKMSRDSLAALKEGKWPEEIKEGLETAQRFFGTFWIVSLEHLAA